MQRTTKEIFDHHMDAFSKKDLSEITKDFNEKSIYINSYGIIALGVDKIIDVYKQYFESQEEGSTSSIKNMIIQGEVVFLQSTSDSSLSNSQ